jgi:hypothetical protein
MTETGKGGNGAARGSRVRHCTCNEELGRMHGRSDSKMRGSERKKAVKKVDYRPSD